MPGTRVYVGSMRMMSIDTQYAVIWAKVLFVITLGKAFVAGAGLGMAALGVVDIAGTLGISPLVEFIQREHILGVFSIGGGVLSLVGQLVWKLVGR